MEKSGGAVSDAPQWRREESVAVWKRRAPRRVQPEEARFRWVSGLGGRRGRQRKSGETRLKLNAREGSEMPTCDEYVDFYLADYARKNRKSSLNTQRTRLQ